jgi:hypothetical protein
MEKNCSAVGSIENGERKLELLLGALWCLFEKTGQQRQGVGSRKCDVGGRLSVVEDSRIAASLLTEKNRRVLRMRPIEAREGVAGVFAPRYYYRWVSLSLPATNFSSMYIFYVST